MTNEIKTFHPIAVAKSIEAKSEAFNFLLKIVSAYADAADHTESPEQLRKWLKEINREGQKAQNLFWPDDE